jgi:hypothetical protein
MQNGQPATKADLEVTKSELQASIASTKNELRAEIASAITTSENRLTDTMRQIETNLLTEFHRYAKGQNARVQSASPT